MKTDNSAGYRELEAARRRTRLIQQDYAPTRDELDQKLKQDYPFLRDDYLKDILPNPDEYKQGLPDLPLSEQPGDYPVRKGPRLLAQAGGPVPAESVQKDGVGTPVQTRTIWATPVDLPAPEKKPEVTPEAVVKAKVATQTLDGIKDKDQKAKVAKTLVDTDPELAAAMKKAQVNEFTSELGYLFEQLSAAIDKREPDREFWKNKMANADKPVKTLNEARESSDKRASQLIRAREADLREAEFGLREKELNGRLTDAEIQRERLKLETQRLKIQADKEVQANDPNSEASRQVQDFVKLTPMGAKLTPDQISKIRASDWGLVKEVNEGNAKLEELKMKIEAQKEEAANRRADRAAAREQTQAIRDAAAAAKKEEKDQKRADAEAELQVGGFTIAPGARPTKKSQEEMAKGYENYLNINSGLERWKNLYEDAGTEQGWGTVKTEMDAERMSIVMALKEMQNLGVLNGQDYTFLSKQLPDTTSWTPQLDRTIRAQFKIFETQMKDRINNRAKARGYVWAEADGAQAAPAETGNKSGSTQPVAPPQKTIKSYKVSPDGKMRVPVYSDDTTGPVERM